MKNLYRLSTFLLCVLSIGTIVYLNSSKQYYKPLKDLENESYEFKHKKDKGTVKLIENEKTFKYVIDLGKSKDGSDYSTIRLTNGFPTTTYTYYLDNEKDIEEGIKNIINKKASYEYKKYINFK